MYSATRNDRNNDDNEIVTVHGVRGILVNKREIEAFHGPIPLNEYPINEDPNPEIIKEPYEVPINTRQDVTVRFLEPPIQPPHGEIVIKYEKPVIPPPPPPLVIRSVPPLKSQPLEPLIIREAPPKIAQPLPPKVIKVLPPKVPPPPRRVIIQKYPPIDDRPRTVIIERWLAPKPQPRRVVVDGYVDVAKLKAAPVRNQIIEYEAPKANLTSEIKDTTVVRADPNQYVSQHRSNLYDPKDLPEIAKQVRPPPGYILASDVAASNQTAPLEGEIEALKRIDLDKEGLSEYKVFLFKSGQQSTTTSTTTVTPVGDRYNPNTTTTTTTTSTAGSGNNSGPNSTIGALVIDSARNPYAGPSPNNGSGYNQQQQPPQQPPPNGSGDTTRIITVASPPSYQVRTATVTSTTTPNNSPDSSSNGAGYYQSQRYTYSYRAENNSSL